MTWVEKYRPKRLDEVVGQEHIIPKIKNILRMNEKPHMLFVGPAGVGKTTTAMAYAKEMFGDDWKARFVELNASDERGIQTIRETVKRGAMSGDFKIIFLDECDNLTRDAQSALRRIMEKAHETKKAQFILSCNYEGKIISPIKSRCAIFRFKPIPEEKIFDYLISILKCEGYNIDVLYKEVPECIELVRKIAEISQGDLRHAINLLEAYVVDDKEQIIRNLNELRRGEVFSEAIEKALEGDLKGAIDIVKKNYYNVDVSDILKNFYKKIDSLPCQTECDKVVKAKLYEKLAQLSNEVASDTVIPLIPILGFISFCYLVRHVPMCPLLREG